MPASSKIYPLLQEDGGAAGLLQLNLRILSSSDSSVVAQTP